MPTLPDKVPQGNAVILSALLDVPDLVNATELIRNFERNNKNENPVWVRRPYQQDK